MDQHTYRQAQQRTAREIIAARIGAGEPPMELPQCPEHGPLIRLAGYPGVLVCVQIACPVTWPHAAPATPPDDAGARP